MNLNYIRLKKTGQFVKVVNDMKDFETCQKGERIKRPQTKGMFEVFIENGLHPMASCCSGPLPKTRIISKENGAYIQRDIIVFDKTYCETHPSEVLPGEEGFDRYDQLWKEAVKK